MEGSTQSAVAEADIELQTGQAVAPAAVHSIPDAKSMAEPAPAAPVKSRKASDKVAHCRSTAA